MTWTFALRASTFIALLTFLMQQELSSAETRLSLTMDPVSAITDDNIKVKCQSRKAVDAGAVFFSLLRDGREVAKFDVTCAGNKVTNKECTDCDIDILSSSCESLVVLIDKARRDTHAGTYQCKAQNILINFEQRSDDSDLVPLTIGDKTPPVQSFTIVDMADGTSITDRDIVPAGINTTVTCETRVASPEPGFVVSITDREDRTNLTIGHRVKFHESVPRQPFVQYRCEVYNGFGVKQVMNYTIRTTYDGIASEVTVPKEAQIQMDSELEICSIRNHPSQQIQITGLDPEMLQPGYPRFKQELGISYAYIKLTQKAAEVKDFRLEFFCSVGKMQPVKASVMLIASNMAMMTAGIVIAAILAFLLIVAGIAYALKRRSAVPKPQSDKSRYDRVNQNDADQTGYANMVSRKMADSNYEPVCV